MFTIASLPPELLSRILVIACELPILIRAHKTFLEYQTVDTPPFSQKPPHQRRMKPFSKIASRVCKLWMELVHSPTNGQLWVTKASLYSRQGTIDNQLAYMKECLRNSANSDIDVTLDDGSPSLGFGGELPLNSSWELTASVDTRLFIHGMLMIRPYCHQLRCLTTHLGSPQTTYCLLAIINNFARTPRLEWLSLNSRLQIDLNGPIALEAYDLDDEPNKCRKINPISLTHLTHLELRSAMVWNKLNLPYGLTSLTLFASSKDFKVSWSEVKHLMLQPNAQFLERLEVLLNHITDVPAEPPSREHRTTVKNLRSLTLYGMESHLLAFLSSFHFPLLNRSRLLCEDETLKFYPAFPVKSIELLSLVSLEWRGPFPPVSQLLVTMHIPMLDSFSVSGPTSSVVSLQEEFVLRNDVQNNTIRFMAPRQTTIQHRNPSMVHWFLAQMVIDQIQDLTLHNFSFYGDSYEPPSSFKTAAENEKEKVTKVIFSEQLSKLCLRNFSAHAVVEMINILEAPNVTDLHIDGDFTVDEEWSIPDDKQKTLLNLSSLILHIPPYTSYPPVTYPSPPSSPKDPFFSRWPFRYFAGVRRLILKEFRTMESKQYLTALQGDANSRFGYPSPLLERIEIQITVSDAEHRASLIEDLREELGELKRLRKLEEHPLKEILVSCDGEMYHIH